ARLKVPMHDLSAMSLSQTQSDLRSNIQSLLDRQGSTLNLLLQRLTFIVSHDDEHLLIVRFCNFMDGTDVRMVQSRGGFSFPDEADLLLFIGADPVREKFQGDQPFQLQVLSFVNHAHATFTQLLQNAIVRDRLANHGMTRRSARSDKCW